jgi:hypothetical protein
VSAQQHRRTAAGSDPQQKSTARQLVMNIPFRPTVKGFGGGMGGHRHVQPNVKHLLQQNDKALAGHLCRPCFKNTLDRKLPATQAMASPCNPPMPTPTCACNMHAYWQ